VISVDVNHAQRPSNDGHPEAEAQAEPTPPPVAVQKPSPWGDWLRAAASWCSERLSRPPLRLIVTGVILLLTGGLLVPNSVWTLPALIIGAVMVAIGWLGGRLDGRFAVEWGQSGTQLEFRARIAAPAHSPPSLPRTSSHSRADTGIPEPMPQDPEIIEAEAHTVEIDLADLEALITAAETPETRSATHASPRAIQKLRVTRAGEHQDR
jgi:hypothetical protein